MKTFSISLLFLSIFGICFAQDDDLYFRPDKPQSEEVKAPQQGTKLDLKAIPKGTTKIIIKTGLNKTDNYLQIGQTLNENDFQIDRVDKDFLTITTVPKSSKNSSYSYILNFLCKDSLVILTGRFMSNMTLDLGSIEIPPSYETIINKGQGGSMYKESFKCMIEFATKISDFHNFVYIIQ